MINKSTLIVQIKMINDQELLLTLPQKNQSFISKLPRSCSRALYSSSAPEDQYYYVSGRLACESPTSPQTFIIERIVPLQ
ncbi:MAG: hypothetical protein ACRC17_10005 [Culicoidibacterales bacterium]